MDDITILVRDRLSLGKVLGHTEEYGEASGAKVNEGKSILWAIGQWEGLEGYGFQVVKENLKVLGVTFDLTGTGERAWEEIGSKVKQVLRLWGTRGLSLGGRVELLKRLYYQ